MPSLLQDPTCHMPTDPILARLVEAAKTAAHDDLETCKRIHRAAGLVEAGAVSVDAQGTYTVLSHGMAYRMVDHTCEDIRRKQAPDGRCKHMYAKWLAIRLAQEAQLCKACRRGERNSFGLCRQCFAGLPPAPRSMQFVASLGDGSAQVHGTVQVWEDGRLIFSPYDSDERIPCTLAEVVLGGRVE